jgi:hypothetical protein
MKKILFLCSFFLLVNVLKSENLTIFYSAEDFLAKKGEFFEDISRFKAESDMLSFKSNKVRHEIEGKKVWGYIQGETLVRRYDGNFFQMTRMGKNLCVFKMRPKWIKKQDPNCNSHDPDKCMTWCLMTQTLFAKNLASNFTVSTKENLKNFFKNEPNLSAKLEKIACNECCDKLDELLYSFVK